MFRGFEARDDGALAGASGSAGCRSSSGPARAAAATAAAGRRSPRRPGGGGVRGDSRVDEGEQRPVGDSTPFAPFAAEAPERVAAGSPRPAAVPRAAGAADAVPPRRAAAPPVAPGPLSLGDRPGGAAPRADGAPRSAPTARLPER